VPGVNKVEEAKPDPEVLIRLVEERMPFGKYKGRLLLDLPGPYLDWFAKKGFPEGNLGRLLQTLHEIKINGLEYLLKPFKSPGGDE